MDHKIIFSNHARARMEERSIPKKIVIGAINDPDKIEKSARGGCRFLIKKIYFNKNAGKDHLLMIICEILNAKINVITVIDTSKISKYL
jgi:hypothetical protein